MLETLMLRHCARCNKDKEQSAFYKHSTTKDGLSYTCKECSKESCRKYRARNAERYYQNQTNVRNTLKGRLKESWHNARTRSKQKGLDFEITIDDLHDMWQKQDGKCAITGCEMTTESGPRKKANPSRVSIDRIDSNLGYVKSNIQLVCWVVNQMKGDRTEAEFRFWIDTIYLALRQSAAKPSSNGGRFNDYPEREYASSEAEAPSPVING